MKEKFRSVCYAFCAVLLLTAGLNVQNNKSKWKGSNLSSFEFEPLFFIRDFRVTGIRKESQEILNPQQNLLLKADSVASIVLKP